MQKILSAAILSGVFLSAVPLAGTALAASDIEASAQAYAEQNLRSWGQDPVIIAAIEAQNATTSALDEAQILAQDTQWRNEVDAGAGPITQAVLGNAASDLLRSRIEATQGVVSEAFVMDAKGLNVATAALTSDYWQGDEAKFTESYGRGVSALHVGEVEFDESSQTFQVQISFTITDAAAAPIGAITVGLNAEVLE